MIPGKNTINLIYSFIILSCLLSGCQKVINIDLNEASPRMVIEGLVTDHPGPYLVTISKSGSYFNEPVLPPVTGALVIITDNAGTTDTLKETSAGMYVTSRLQGVPGRTYSLTVVYDNTEYTGSSTMHRHVEIDSLKLKKSDSQGFGFGGNNKDKVRVDIHCFFKDPDEKNFYRVKSFTNDTTRVGNYRLYDDQYTNGEETDLRVGRTSAGETNRYELYSLDKSTYEYYRTLSDLLHTNPIFGSTPANPVSNISNRALGYFGAAAISQKTILITDSLLNAMK